MKYREAQQVDPAQNQGKDAAEPETRISKMTKMASDMENPATALREVDKLEGARNTLPSEICRLESEYTAVSMLDNIPECKIEQILRGIAEKMESLNREALKDLLSSGPRMNARSITTLVSLWGIRWRPQGDSNPCCRDENPVS